MPSRRRSRDRIERRRAGVPSSAAVLALTLTYDAARLPYSALERAVPIHPTVSELIPTLPGDMKPAA